MNQQGLAAVLDWELTHLSVPAEDLGWLCVQAWRFGQWQQPVGGFGTRAALIRAYAEAGGQIGDRGTSWRRKSRGSNQQGNTSLHQSLLATICP